MEEQIFSAKNRVAVVVNGNAKQVTQDLVEVLDELIQSGDLFVSRSLEEGRDIARRIVDRGYPTVLTGGGDGTFSQMVTWITRECEAREVIPPRFGLLRLGTGNAIAWVLGAQNPRGRGVAADLGRLRNEGGERSLRLLDAEGMLTPFAGVGGDATALKHFREVKERFSTVPLLRRYGLGGLAYAVSLTTKTAPQMLYRSRVGVRVINVGGDAFRLDDQGQPLGDPIKRDEVIFEGSLRMLAMSTIPYWGFGVRIFPFANERDDRFSLRTVDISPVDAALNLRQIWDGSYRHPRVRDYLVEKVRIECDEPVPFQVGGDPTEDRKSMVVGLHPEPIRVVDYYSPPPV